MCIRDRYYKGDTDCPIRQYPLTTLSDTLSHLKAERKLEGADSPEAYGLDNPSVRFDTVSSDGSSHSILVGSQVPGTGGSGPDLSLIHILGLTGIQVDGFHTIPLAVDTAA